MTLTLDQTPVGLWQRVVSKARRILRDYKRQALRKKILSLPPMLKREHAQDFSLHMLLCLRDLEMGICSAKSLEWASGESFHFTFHEDGSLREEHVDLLKKHFPFSTIIRRAQSDKELSEAYAHLPGMLEWRKGFPLALKIIDVYHYASHNRVVFFDPDIVFFQRPEELFVSKGNLFNKDIESAYLSEPETMEEAWHIKIVPCINSGLWNVSRDMLDMKKVNDIVSSAAFPELSKKRRHVSEQTIMALLASIEPSKSGVFSASYDVDYFKQVQQSVCKHYVGRIRHGYELEGLAYLLDEKAIVQSWKPFTH